MLAVAVIIVALAGWNERSRQHHMNRATWGSRGGGGFGGYDSGDEFGGFGGGACTDW
jgi:hypothetical protein